MLKAAFLTKRIKLAEMVPYALTLGTLTVALGTLGAAFVYNVTGNAYWPLCIIDLFALAYLTYAFRTQASLAKRAKRWSEILWNAWSLLGVCVVFYALLRIDPRSFSITNFLENLSTEVVTGLFVMASASATIRLALACAEVGKPYQTKAGNPDSLVVPKPF